MAGAGARPRLKSSGAPIDSSISPPLVAHVFFLRKERNALQIDMSPKHLPETDTEAASAIFPFVPGELPLTVREAALYLGVE
jgi:hypothetical protein